MTFKMQLVCMLFPGGVLIVIGGALLDPRHGLGLSLALVGFLLLLAWPIFSVTVHIRHGRKLKRHTQQRGSAPVSITQVPGPSEELSIKDPLHTFVTAVEARILTLGLPVAFLGGLGIFCLVTAGDDPDEEVFKAFVGVGSLGLLGGYLLMLVGGRNPLTLRIIGIAVAVFGLAGLIAVASVLGRDGLTNVGDIVMSVASVVMVAAGLWLAITGRNTFTPTD